ncbi:hypothetical protein SprV_0501944200 [Sparganum proliferum]
MNVGNSCLQLKEKVEKIGTDLDNVILRNFRSTIRKIQAHYPDFAVPDFSFELSSQTTCSRIAEDEEMKDVVSSTPQANTTLKRSASRGSRAVATESVSKAKKTRVETSTPAQPSSTNLEGLKTPPARESILKKADAAPLQSNQFKTPARKTPSATAAPVLNQTYKKPNPPTNAAAPPTNLVSPTAVLFGDAQQHTTSTVIASPVVLPSKTSLHKTPTVVPPRSSRVSATSIMTEDSDAGGKPSGGRTDETLEASSLPAVTPPQDVLPTSAPSASEVQAAPAVGLLPTTATPQVPWSAGAQTWLSRLGWLKSASKPTATTAAAASSLSEVPEDESGPVHSRQLTSGQQTARPDLLKTQSRLNLKNTYTTPRQILASKRLPTTLKQGYRPNTARPAEEAIREASLPSASTAAPKLRGSTQNMKSATAGRQLNDQARINEFIQRMAAKEERLRQLTEERERERQARIKAQREHMEAVRANALRLAKERQQLAATKIAAEQRVQRPPQKTSTSFKQNTSAKAPNCPLLPQNPANKTNFASQQQPATALGTQPQRVTNVLNTVFENFDCVVRPPTISKPVVHTATTTVAAATSTGTKAVQPGQSAPAPSIRDSPLSYDMTGLLSEYDSDSENEARRKKRPIPSWARAGGKQLIDLVTHCYSGQVKWQTLFRPAETIHFTDEELFYGYKYRSRKRGSSVVWLSPSAGTCV